METRLFLADIQHVNFYLITLQTSTAYHRDQWLHSLKWKVQLLRYRKLINKINDPESLVKELKVNNL